MLHAGLQCCERQLDQVTESEFLKLYNGGAAGEGHDLHVADAAEEEDELDEGVYQLSPQ